MSYLTWKLTEKIEKAERLDKLRLITELTEIQKRPAWQALVEVMQQALKQNMEYLRGLQDLGGRDAVTEGVTQGELNILELMLDPAMGVAAALKMETVDEAVEFQSPAS
jgi:hypothetical protein